MEIPKPVLPKPQNYHYPLLVKVIINGFNDVNISLYTNITSYLHI